MPTSVQCVVKLAKSKINNNPERHRLVCAALLPMLSVAVPGCVDAQDDTVVERSAAASAERPMLNPLGASATVSRDGAIDLDNEFFEDFGTNDRTCVACHAAGEGWTVSAKEIRRRFEATAGLDPIFRPVDGANSPDADVSTEAARREAYSMLLTRGTIRVGIGIPADAEFELVDIDDPYDYAHDGELSLFRRPLPTANLGFIPAVMWDGRVADGTILERLAAQSNGATLGHAEALEPLSQETRESIVDFESGLSNAQIILTGAGRLDSDGARGGPEELVDAPVERGAWDLYDAWRGEDGKRGAIARGQEIFNTKKSAGGGLCIGCHNVKNVGASFAPIFFDIGTSAGSRRTPDMPLYTLRNLETGEIRTTTDPGRALITGKWRDVNRFKAPTLRGLGARAPYFHNGMADTLEDVVRFYEESLRFSFTDAERADLVAFLEAL